MDRLKALKQKENKWSMYNFKDLIKDYSKEQVYRIEESDSHRDYENGGELVKGKPKLIELDNVAIVPLSKNDYMLDEGGTYNHNTRKMYCYEKMKKGTKVKHKDKTYTVMGDFDYEDFDFKDDKGLSIYMLEKGDSND